ncbi:YpsA SLOG family protein [Legionella sp. CNM-1927-20]|uniref:YpsA SLOG family protein n=1 Tax=Legionella sp. CNM-1927-20 TaxID=3422221 RepID=UPI00403AE9D9
MAIYRFSAQIISRSQGRSIVAASAYRAGEKLLDERTGVIHDFTNKIEITGNFNTDKENYVASTKANIKDSDGTLIIVPKLPFLKDGGTAFTISEASVQGKPYLIIDISQSEEENFSNIQEFIKQNDIKILNVAGPRESNTNGIYQKTFDFLRYTFQQLEQSCSYSI